MIYIVYRLDRDEGAAEIRSQVRAAHLQYMESLGSKIRLGGPVLDEHGVTVGGMMLVEAESRDEVIEILANDPFEIARLSGRIDVYLWRESRRHSF